MGSVIRTLRVNLQIVPGIDVMEEYVLNEKDLERPLESIPTSIKTTKNTVKEAIETENDEVPDIATIHVNKETIAHEIASKKTSEIAFSIIQISQDF